MNTRTYNKRYYRKNKKRLKIQARSYRLRNRKAILAQRKESYNLRKELVLKRNKNWRKKNKSKISLQKRLQRLRSMGLSASELQRAVSALTAKSLICEICGTNTPGGNGGWLVDHNHKTKKFRGILCNSCNSILGFSKDQIKVLNSAILYLRKRP
jgi:Recombination endonuclease VII